MKKMIDGYASDLNDAKLNMKRMGLEYTCNAQDWNGKIFFIIRQSSQNKAMESNIVYVVWVHQPDLIQYFSVTNDMRDGSTIVITNNYHKIDCLKD